MLCLVRINNFRGGLTEFAAEKQDHCAQAISAAFASMDEKFSVKLSSDRQVSISSFHGGQFVNIGEFYNNDGEMLPGFKCISMNAQQWNAFRCAIDAVKQEMALHPKNETAS